MKRYCMILVGIMSVIGLTACGSTDSKTPETQTTVDRVLQSQAAENDKTESVNSTADAEENNEAQEEVIPGYDGGFSNQAEEETESVTEGIDYDLSQMDSEMIYATVFQMMMTPESYEGKRIRIEGQYSVGYYEEMSQYYHYVLVADATACCSQGIEFVWGDGSHIYPDEYPKENTDIIVTGVFETYQEEGDEMVYCHLKDAVLEMK